MRIRALVTATEEAGIRGSSVIWRISIFLVAVGLSLYIVGFSTDYWCELDDAPKPGANYELSTPVVIVDSHYGLWRRCVQVYEGAAVVKEYCEDMDNDDDWKPAAKAMNCVGLIFMCVGLLPAILAGWWHNSRLMGSAGTLILIGSITSAIGASLFIGEARDADDDVDAGYSVYLALFGCMVLILSGGTHLLAIRSEYKTIA